ncbi:alpha/beta hydrolase [Aquipuribacter sp. MA13-6]|uniref:alpha/beta hydrolase n=1 Tax=unclassified Aquipuribacter TaxID=2635084 RepID=UPI003EEADAA9
MTSDTSLPPSAAVRLVSAVGRRLGAVGISGVEAQQVVASRDRVPHPALGTVSGWVLGRPAADVRRSRARTASGVALVVHTPRVAPGTVLPVVVHLHGGGWVLGGVDDTPWWVAALARAVPAVVVSVDYRLAPEHPYPAAVHDCLEAVRWVAAHPEHVGAQARVRVDRLALVGDSAGANLAAVTAARLRDEPVAGDPVVVHQALVYPAVDATLSSPSVAANADAPILTRADMERFLQLYTAGTGVDTRHPWLSPLHAPSLVGLPPTTVLTAEHDPLRDDGTRFAEALRAAGVPVRLSDYPGAVHGFLAVAGVDRVRTRHALAEVATALRGDLPAVVPGA